MGLSKDYLVNKLKDIDSKLIEVDNALYTNDEYFDEWYKVRQANLLLEELIESLE